MVRILLALLLGWSLPAVPRAYADATLELYGTFHAMGVTVILGASDDPNLNDRLHFAVQARALAEIRFSPRVAVFGGGGVSSVYSEYSSNATQKSEPLGVVGISLF